MDTDEEGRQLPLLRVERKEPLLKSVSTFNNRVLRRTLTIDEVRVKFQNPEVDEIDY